MTADSKQRRADRESISTGVDVERIAKRREGGAESTCLRFCAVVVVFVTCLGAVVVVVGLVLVLMLVLVVLVVVVVVVVVVIMVMTMMAVGVGGGGEW
jgi:Flp pilus assembly protein TadB